MPFLFHPPSSPPPAIFIRSPALRRPPCSSLPNPALHRIEDFSGKMQYDGGLRLRTLAGVSPGFERIVGKGGMKEG
ncbi:MAG: hypothetical protein D6795_02120 [Deltaproteobacteria bacterium]|nr:MAG: hypothetical protein D6795_02120 [Deltaproteobacteria bacterium]